MAQTVFYYISDLSLAVLFSRGKKKKKREKILIPNFSASNFLTLPYLDHPNSSEWISDVVGENAGKVQIIKFGPENKE